MVKLACDLWPHHRKASTRCLKSFEEATAPADVANFMSGIDSNEDSAFNDLQTAWKHILWNLSHEQVLQITSLILSKNIVGPEDQPDKALSLWLDSMIDDICAEILHTCLALQRHIK